MSYDDRVEEEEPSLREVLSTVGRLASTLELLLQEGLPKAQADMKATFDTQLAVVDVRVDEVRREAKRNKVLVRLVAVLLLVACVIGWREHTGRIAEHHDRIVAQADLASESKARAAALARVQYQDCGITNDNRRSQRSIDQAIVDTALKGGVNKSVLADIQADIDKLVPTICVKPLAP